MFSKIKYMFGSVEVNPYKESTFSGSIYGRFINDILLTNTYLKSELMLVSPVILINES